MRASGETKGTVEKRRQQSIEARRKRELQRERRSQPDAQPEVWPFLLPTDGRTALVSIPHAVGISDLYLLAMKIAVAKEAADAFRLLDEIEQRKQSSDFIPGEEIKGRIIELAGRYWRFKSSRLGVAEEQAGQADARHILLMFLAGAPLVGNRSTFSIFPANPSLATPAFQERVQIEMSLNDGTIVPFDDESWRTSPDVVACRFQLVQPWSGAARAALAARCGWDDRWLDAIHLEQMSKRYLKRLEAQTQRLKIDPNDITPEAAEACRRLDTMLFRLLMNPDLFKP